MLSLTHALLIIILITGKAKNTFFQTLSLCPDSYLIENNLCVKFIAARHPEASSDDQMSCQSVYHSDYSFDLYCESSNTTSISSSEPKYEKSEECVTSVGVERLEHRVATGSVASHVTVHVFDFNHISGSIYIDFAHLRLTDTSPIVFINLVARQFLTFKLINVPGALRHRYRFLVIFGKFFFANFSKLSIFTQ